MKKIISLLLCLMLLCLAGTAFAAEYQPGDTVTVTVSVSSSSAVMATISVSASTSVFEFVDAKTSGVSGAAPNNPNGVFAINSSDSIAVLNGTIGSITLRIKDDAAPGSYPITLSASSVFDTDFMPASLSVSGSTTVVIPAPACEHSYDKGKETTAATCEKAGVKTYTCTKCGETKTEEIAALGHSYDDGVQTKAPTCKDEGVMTFTCSVCKDSYTEKIAKSDKHTWDDGVVTKKMTCLEDGEKTFTCTVCKATDVTKIKAPGKHNYDESKSETSKAPTCTEEGMGSFTCTDCGAKLEGDKIPALGHDLSTTVTKEANCGVDGEKTTTCSRCDYKETEKIPATGKHSYEEKVTTEATCTEKGEKTFTCSVCKDKYTEEIAAKGHTPGADLNEKAPTCTKPGYKFFTCTACGTEVKEAEIPATGKHIYEVTEEVAATCETDGKRVSKCTYKGCTETKTEVLPMFGHDWSEWVIYEEANNKSHVCATCGKTETKKLSTYYTMTVCSYGIRFRDLENPITKDWYMFTPVDLSVEGEQTIDLIAGNMHQIGTATVLVKDGKVTVTTKANGHNIAYAEEFLTFVPALSELTALDFDAMTNYAYGEEISIEETLGGDTKVLLVMRNRAWYEDNAYGVNSYSGKGKAYDAYVETLKELMD